MSDPANWPFKGKPTTNSALQITTVMAWTVSAMYWPIFGALTIGALAGYGLYRATRSIYRDIRKEWRS